MKKAIFIILITAIAFCSGFAFKSILSQNKHIRMKKVTGI